MHVFFLQLLLFFIFINSALAVEQRTFCKEPYADSFVAGEALVKFKSFPSVNKLNRLASYKSSINKLLKVYDLAPLTEKSEAYLLKANSDLSFSLLNTQDQCKQTLELVKNLQDQVEIIEPNFIYKPKIVKDFFYTSLGKYWDFYWLDEMWGLKKLSPSNAWKYSTGEDTLVAVLDTGVDYNHPDLKANIWQDPVSKNYGYDFFETDNDPMDITGHGTQVAGIISSITNDIGVLGLAYNAQILPLRVGGDEGILSSAVIKAIDKAIELRVDVINASYGGYNYSRLQEEAYRRAYDQNIVLVGAAGNDNRNLSTYPAKLSTFISVAASDEVNEKASFSNYASDITVAAPGSFILSTIGNDTTMAKDYPELLLKMETPEHGYYLDFGTSFAAPFVSALAALLKSYAPEFTVPEIKSLIEKGATPLKDNAGLGAGLINAAKSLEEAAKLKSAKALDINGDSLISLAEIAKLIWASRFKKTSLYAKALDVNNDKLLNPEDFKIILANNLGTYNLAQNEDYKTVVKALNAVDRNANGILTKKESQAFRQAINATIKKASSSNSLLNLYDVNADGKIDLEDKETIVEIFLHLNKEI
jgi:subtilisin family serine protease